MDGNKLNNHIRNLEFCTRSENQRHAFSNGLYQRKGGKIQIVETGEVFKTQKECADAIGGSQAAVWGVLNGERTHHKGYTFKYLD